MERLFSSERKRVREVSVILIRSDRSAHFGKPLDLSEVIADNLWMFVLEVLGELWDVVHFNTVPQTRLFVKTLALSVGSTWVVRSDIKATHILLPTGT